MHHDPARERGAPEPAAEPQTDWLGALLAHLIRVAGLLHPDQRLLGHPISLSEGFALLELAGAEPLTQRDLVDRLGLEKSTVSRLVASLASQGLIARDRNPENRRFARIALTEHGRSVASGLTSTLREQHARLLGAMTAAERDALATGLGALLRAMGQAPPPHSGAGSMT